MSRKHFLFQMGWVLSLVLIPSLAFGAVDPELASMVSKLQKQVNEMQVTIIKQDNKIQALENRPAATPIAGQAAAVEPTPPMTDYEFNDRLSNALGGSNKWLKDLSFKGDLRLRYEAFKFTNGTLSETDDRNRFRYRLRFGFEKKFNEDLYAGFALASGEQEGGTNVDPTSTNTTFDNNFNFKPVFIEKAYATYYPPFLRVGPVKKVQLTAGKHDNPFEKGSSDMVWDRDVKPEGVSEKIDIKVLESENFNLNTYFLAGQYVLDEDSTVGGDANLFGFQGGINPVVYTPFFERPLDLLGAFSYYSFQNYARKSNFLIGSTSLARGNANVEGVSTELDAGDFGVFETYFELSLYPFGVPVRPFFDFARNTQDQSKSPSFLHDADAFSFGVKLGGIVKKRDWELTYAWKEIGANSVVGAFNDSDFGNGHSGKRGSVFKAAYALTDTVTINGAFFLVENLNPTNGGVLDLQQRRFQVDLNWKF